MDRRYPAAAVGVAALTVRQCGESSLDLAVHDIRPIALNANQRRADTIAKGVVRVVPAIPNGLLNLLVARVLIDWRIDGAVPVAISQLSSGNGNAPVVAVILQFEKLTLVKAKSD